jgi:hypothetical protein
MKLAILKENYNEQLAGEIFGVVPDDWTNHITGIMEFLSIPDGINYNFLKIVETQAVAEKWVKDSEVDKAEQPMIPERWSDGITTVYSEAEVPVVDEAPDADFQYFKATNDDSWTYVPAVPYLKEVVEDTEALNTYNTKRSLRKAVQGAMNFGQQLLVEFAVENVSMGITQDGMTKQVRQVMSEVMSAIQTGSLYDAIEEIDAIQNKDGKYITDERLAIYKQKIVDYLAQ